MQIFHHFPATPLPRETTLTIGVFDGVHRGHQALIGEAVRRAQLAQRACGVLTFDPHPVEVLAPQADIRYLTTLEERAHLVEQLGVDFLHVIHFTREVSQLSAREFVRPLVDRFGMRDLVIGYDFTLGHRRQGDAAYLRALGAEWDFALEVVAPVYAGGEIISSTRIRKLLQAGRIDDALALWGREQYELVGILNESSAVPVDPRRQLPRDGRYPATAQFHGVGELECAASITGSQIHLECDTPLAPLIGRQVRLCLRQPHDEDSLASPESDGFEEIEHTADVALRVRARSLPLLFSYAARGMFALMTDTDQISTETELTVLQDAPDRETLLVNWLNELLYQHEMREQMFREFDVTLEDGCKLHATVRGGRPGADIRKHIKAVTFHDLEIVEHHGRFETTIVFDI